MNDLAQLYQDVILTHNKSPKNFGKLENPTHLAHGHNPLCGDDYWVYVVVEEGVVKDVSFYGTGCAISKASASLMTTSVMNKSYEEVMALKEAFITLVTQENIEEAKQKIGKLKVFEGVRQFPARVKCAALSWRALEAALNQPKHITTGESLCQM